MSAVRFYVSGFRDGHLVYSDNARDLAYREIVNGWRVDLHDGVAVVTAVMPEWRGPLPQLGATLLDCDGRIPHAIVAADVAPYVDRRELPEVRNSLFSAISSPSLAGMELKHGRFRRLDGSSQELDISYHSMPGKAVWDGLRNVSVRIPDNRNRYDFNDGVLWIGVANFMLTSKQAKELDLLLREVAALRGVRQIVFDTRGNSGGDSGVGQQILEAATGGLVFDTEHLDRLAQVYAQWRVSNIAISGMDRYIDMTKARYGSTDSRTSELLRLRERLLEAKRGGHTWVRTEGSPRLTRSEILARHGRLRRFDGPVAVITDGNCASACLDFVDQVRLMPGSVQLGHATSSDTVYLEQSLITLPSGNLLFMPMKVWRNRVRGDGEILIPDIPLEVNMNNDEAVRAAVMSALEKL